MSDSLATPCTVAHQPCLSMGFSRQESWSGLPIPLPQDLPDPGIKPMSPVAPALQAIHYHRATWGSPDLTCMYFQIRVLHFQIKVFHWSLQPHWCLCKKASPVSLAFTQTFHLMVVYLEERPCIRIYAVIEKKLLWGSWLRKNEIPYLASVSMISQLDFATLSTEIFSKILGNSSKHSTQNSVSFSWFLKTKHVISRKFWRWWL